MFSSGRKPISRVSRKSGRVYPSRRFHDQRPTAGLAQTCILFWVRSFPPHLPHFFFLALINLGKDWHRAAFGGYSLTDVLKRHDSIVKSAALVYFFDSGNRWVISRRYFWEVFFHRVADHVGNSLSDETRAGINGSFDVARAWTANPAWKYVFSVPIIHACNYN